jgi:DNA-binding IclR family transcriptional regulator
MNLPDRPLLVLKVLKGSPNSCLTAMLLHGEPVSTAWLTFATGYHPASVSRALRILSYYEMVHRVPGCKWVLGPKTPFVGSYRLAK